MLTLKENRQLHPRNSDGKKLAGIGMTNAATMTLAPETTNAQNVVPASTPPPTAPHPIENFLSSVLESWLGRSLSHWHPHRNKQR